MSLDARVALGRHGHGLLVVGAGASDPRVPIESFRCIAPPPVTRKMRPLPQLPKYVIRKLYHGASQPLVRLTF